MFLQLFHVYVLEHFQLDPFLCTAHSAVLLKAESAVDKVEWINKISNVIQARGGQIRVSSDGGPTMRQSLSDGSLVSYSLIDTVRDASFCHFWLQSMLNRLIGYE